MAYKFPRCDILPLPDHQISFRIDGIERLRWHFGPSYPRPFFYPLIGPSGTALTRMGHPGAPNHDHHRSIWFAHEKVLGINFWTEGTPARIRQKSWLCYQDGHDEAVMAVLLGWYDGHDPKELLQQELVAAVRPGPDGETLLELQATFRPSGDMLEFGKTNFGFLAVHMAKNISEHFGGGVLTNSEGAKGESAIFGKQAKWMDYSGSVPNGSVEGITYFDHPNNPGYPCYWHVREDGWMGASVCLQNAVPTTKKQPLTVRYLLHAHKGGVSSERATEIAKQFNERKRFEVVKATVKHQQFLIQRVS